jgi:hypothetical protein
MTGRGGRLLLLACGLVVGLAGAVALGAWIASDETATKVTTSQAEPKGRTSVAADGPELAREAASVGHVVYWVGPVSNRRYELTQTEDGRAYVRYLTVGVEPGDVRPQFLTVGTYPVDNAYGITQAAAARAGARRVRAPAGAVAFTTTSRPQSVYLAYEGSDLQIELFHPTPQQARRLVESGRIRPVG